MRRLAATLRTDVRLQLRNGFYYAVAFVLALFAVLITQLPEFDWAPWLAPVIFGNLVTATYFFVGGLVLLEKGEGTLEAQVVTPLRVGEYLGSKVITLTALSVVENLVMVVLVSGLQYSFLPLILGIVCSSAIYILLGFLAAARYDSINEYIMPSVMFVTVLSIPYLDYFGIWQTPWMILHPLQGPLIIMKAAFLPVGPGEFVAGLISSIVWIGGALVLAKRAFRRFVIQKEGVR